MINLENYKYNLSKLSKCGEFWDDMKPVQGGRHCARCEKKIIDFSGMTFTEIALFMAESKETLCGFYLPEQIGQPQQRKVRFPVAAGISTLLVTATISKAEVVHTHTEQTQAGITRFEYREADALFTGESNKPDTICFSGNIQYYDSTKRMHLSVAYASVVVKGTKTGVVTNEHGDFILNYLPDSGNSKIDLIISCINFETKQISINYNGQNKIEIGTIVLEPASVINYWVTVKKRSRLNTLWRKITAPFRRH